MGKVRRIEKKKQIIPFKKLNLICITITKAIQIKLIGIWFTIKIYDIEKWVDNNK